MSKKLISLLLTVVMVATAFGAIMTVNVAADEATTPTVYLDVDYEDMAQNATDDEKTAYTSTVKTGSFDADTASMGFDSTEKAFKIDIGYNDGTGNPSQAVVGIPLTTAIDTTQNKKFNITIKMKLPDTNTGGANGNHRLQGFPILAANADYGIGGSDGHIGLFYASWGTTNTAVALKAKAPSTFVNADGETVTVTGGEADNFYMKNMFGSWNDNNTWNKGTVPSNNSSYSFVDRATVLNYVTYKWYVDTETKTFRAWYSTDDGATWTAAYGAVTDVYSGQTEPGVLPVAVMPDAIRALKFSSYNYSTDTNSKYYIKSIKVEETSAYVPPKYSWSLKDEDGTIAASKYTVPSGVTSSITEADGFTFTCPIPTNYPTYAIDFDIEDIALGENPVEIVLDDVQFPAGDYQLKGFPLLVGASGDPTMFGFSSDYTAAGRTSMPLAQALTHNTSTLYLGANKDGAPFRLAAKSVGGETVPTTADYTKYKNYTDQTLNIGSTGGTSATAVGASAAKYDYKFVIDPVSKTYRYYQKAATATEWVEIYDGLACYPVAFGSTDTLTTAGFTNVLPESLTALKLRLQPRQTSQEVMTFKIGNITVNELDKYEGFESRITMRDYTITSNVTTDATVLVDLTTKVTNYTDAAQADAKIFLAVYDKNGLLAKVVPVTQTLNKGDNTVEFTNVELAAGSTNFGGNATLIFQDYYTYKLFVWESTANIRPLTTNVSELSTEF